MNTISPDGSRWLTTLTMANITAMQQVEAILMAMPIRALEPLMAGPSVANGDLAKTLATTLMGGGEIHAGREKYVHRRTRLSDKDR